MAEGRADAEKAFDRFLAKYEAKYDKAAACLAKDRLALLVFYDFPAEHWKHVLQSHREHLRDRPSPDDTGQGLPLARHRRDHGVQDDPDRAKLLATPRRSEPGVKFTDGIEAGQRDAA